VLLDSLEETHRQQVWELKGALAISDSISRLFETCYVLYRDSIVPALITQRDALSLLVQEYQAAHDRKEC